MKAFIEQLFLQSNFVPLAAQREETRLYINSEPNNKVSYWILMERETPTLLDDQVTIFNEFKSIVKQQDFDKNCSLLLLIKQSERSATEEFKKKVLLIEDNPYYFKKYVLCYTLKEFEELTVARNNRTELAFLERHMISRACFDVYKKEPTAENWQCLVFRTVLKLPFVNVKVEVKSGLSALFEDNNALLESKQLHNLDNAVRAIFFDKSPDELSKIAPLQILEALNINQFQNDDQNSAEQNTEL